MKLLLLFVAVFTAIAINMPDNMIARLGFDPHYFIIILIAWGIARLLRDRGPATIVLVLFTVLAANMPGDFILNFGIDRDYLFGAFVALVLTPLVVNWLE